MLAGRQPLRTRKSSMLEKASQSSNGLEFMSLYYTQKSGEKYRNISIVFNRLHPSLFSTRTQARLQHFLHGFPVGKGHGVALPDAYGIRLLSVPRTRAALDDIDIAGHVLGVGCLNEPLLVEVPLAAVLLNDAVAGERVAAGRLLVLHPDLREVLGLADHHPQPIADLLEVVR